MSTQKSNAAVFFKSVENPTPEKIEALQAEGRIVQFRPSRDGHFISGQGWITLDGRVEGSEWEFYTEVDAGGMPGDPVHLSADSFIRASKAANL